VSIGHRPTVAEIQAANLLLAPWRWATAPRFEGIEHIPVVRPALLAGNHTLMGVLDSPLLVLGTYQRCGVFARALGDHLHFRVPVWRDLLARFGVVDGTPENVHALMQAREHVLVFPGGGREVFKRKGEAYTLIWGQRLGFARLAITHGYPIVPFAAVGAEDAFDILVDGDELLSSPLGPLIRRVAPRLDAVPPVLRGVGPTAVPRPERFYFRFLPPIETTGLSPEDATCFAVREQVRLAIERGIADLLLERERDPERALLPRMLGRIASPRRRSRDRSRSSP
jgi:1-acyl-sn-glycerol-3-phosphate acyltransferase